MSKGKEWFNSFKRHGITTDAVITKIDDLYEQIDDLYEQIEYLEENKKLRERIKEYDLYKQIEYLDENKKLRESMEAARSIINELIILIDEGEYIPDSFTTQPARLFLKREKGK